MFTYLEVLEILRTPGSYIVVNPGNGASVTDGVTQQSRKVHHKTMEKLLFNRYLKWVPVGDTGHSRLVLR